MEEQEKKGEENKKEEEKSDKSKIDECSINEFLEIIKKEYENERAKKQSFETRAGFIITFVSAIFAFVMDKVKFNDIQQIINKPIYFLGLIKIIIFILIYIIFCWTLYASIKVIYTKEHKVFEVEKIKATELGMRKFKGLLKIVELYKVIIKDHREKNNIRAKFLNYAFLGIAIELALISLYINL